MRLFFAVTAFAFLSTVSCGPFVTNTDKPTGVYIAGAKKVSGEFGVQLADAPPGTGGEQVSGVSCKNKIWDPSPSKEAAIAVMRREAAEAGFNRVYVRSVQPAGNAILMNCWSAIEAKGIAFND